MTRPTITIKQVCTDSGAYLLADSNNKLWIMGHNKYWRLGIQPDIDLSRPFSLGIWLEPGEAITKFSVNQRLTVIYTSAKRLFIANTVLPSAQEKRVPGIDEIKGKYLYPLAASSNTYLDDWPARIEPIPIVPYARTEAKELPDLSDLFKDVKGGPAAPAPSPSQPAAPTTVDIGDFGVDPLAIQEADAHDFGLGKHFYDYPNMFNAIGDLLGTELSTKAGFIEPLLDIVEVTCAAESVFFRRGPNHYVYNWRLIPRLTMFGNGGLSFIPHQHAKVLTYYQICLPFDPEIVLYLDKYVYMKHDSRHSILTSFRRVTQPWTTVSWLYFQFDDLDLNQLYVSNKTGVVYVKQGESIMQYMHLLKGFRPIIQGCIGARIVTRPDNKSSYPICLRADGGLIEHVNKRLYCQTDPWLEYTIHVSLFKDAFVVIVDVDDAERYRVLGEVLLFNVHNLRYTLYRHWSPIFFDDQGGVHIYTLRTYDVPYMQLEKEFKCKDRTHRIYKWIDLPKVIDNLSVSSASVLFESQGRYYRSTVKDGYGPAIEIKLEHEKRQPAEVIKGLTKRCTTKGGTNVDIQIELNRPMFEPLCKLAEMFGKDIVVRPVVTHRSERVSQGVGLSRFVAQTALTQFADRFLLMNGACAEYNLEALSELSTPQLFITGRALHMAMYMNRTCLSIRMPIAFLVAILGREPELDELEFFLQQESPDAYDTITSYYEDLQGLADCGYSNYRECLNHRVFYEHNDPETNNLVRRISNAMAAGFTSFAEIENINKMNLPTIDSYVSGPYLIDRASLSSMINCNNSVLLKFVRSLVERLGEDRLRTLLCNWTGSSVFKGTRLRLQETSSADIRFATCSRELYLNPKLFEKNDRLRLPDLIDILTSPMTSVKS